MSTERVADVMTRQDVEGREQALRALLRRPLMTPADASFLLVRRHAEFLHLWFARETGWRLRVERDFARLYKLPADRGDGTRGQPQFDRRRYVLLCLACAVLERADPQITLRTLGERLLEQATDGQLEAMGFRFRLETLQERRELVQVCRFLLELGVLHRVAGEEEGYLQQGGDALYDVSRRILAALLACTRGPSTFAAGDEPGTLDGRIAALVEEYRPDDTDGRRNAARHVVARRLLDDPVVYFDELGGEERDYLLNQRGVMGSRLRAASGLEPELRAEGAALVDPFGELSDLALPAEGTQAHVTLLVAQFLAGQASGESARPVSKLEIAACLRQAADRFGRYWKKSARDPGAETELAGEALERLVALKLVRRAQGMAAFEARPALFRYRFDEARLESRAMDDTRPDGRAQRTLELK